MGWEGQPAIAVKAEQKPRAWSKHSAGSSAYDRINNKADPAAAAAAASLAPGAKKGATKACALSTLRLAAERSGSGRR